MVVVVNNCAMAPVKIKFVVSFSSQDKIHKASNLLLENSGTKRWLADPLDRTGQIDAVFQLDQPCHLSYIDIGVIWCASIEVRVGKSDWPQGHSYVTLVPTQVLMSSVDSRLSRNSNRACMFTKAHFAKAGGSDLSSWDRIQVIGLQPWRKDVQLGLSFLRVSCSDNVDSASNSCTLPSGAGSKARTTLSVAAMEQHFFGNRKDEEREDTALKNRLQKMAATAEGMVAIPDILSRNARMVLMANKKCSTKSESLSTESDSATQQSDSVEDDQQSIKPEEVTQFLGTLDITKGDIESLKVSDLRHKFEKLKWRKLTADEKRTFYTCCQDFIGGLFDDDANDASTSGPAATTSTATSEHSPYRNSKHRDTAEKASDGARHSFGGIHRTLAPKTKDQECRKATPTTSQSRSSNINGCNDGKSPRSGESGGFLTNVFSMTDLTRDKSTSVAPNKSVDKAQDGHGHRTDAASSAGRCGAPSTPTHFNSKLKAGSPSMKEKASDGQRFGARQNGKPEIEDSYFCRETIHSGSKDRRKQRKLSSPAPSESVPTSNINKSLLNTHRQFVKKRLKNISSTRSSKSVTSTATATSSVSHGLESDEEDTPARSPCSFSHILAKKRQGTPLSMSDNISRKQRPRFCSTPKTADTSVNIGKEEEEDDWLNAKRDADRGKGRGSCENSRNRGGGGRIISDSRNGELGNSPSPASSSGRGGRRGRGQGGSGAAKSRLDMPAEPAASSSQTTPTPKTSAATSSRSRTPPTSNSHKSSSSSTNYSVRTPKSPASSLEGGLKTLRELASSTSRTPAVVLAETDSDEDPFYRLLTFNDPFSGELTIDDPFHGELTINDESTAFVECPVCEEMFPADTIQTHAADCPGNQASAVGGGLTFVQCPLCEDMFTEDVIVQHASHCCL